MQKLYNRLHINQGFVKQQQQHRCLYRWLYFIFNSVDKQRIKQVGPDRAAAEWLMRCGAQVKWKNFDRWQTDYNTLPGRGFNKYKIESIYADNAAIMHTGFNHLDGLKYLKSLTLITCPSVNDECLSMLNFVRETLQELEIKHSGNITDDGIKSLHQLTNLQKLTLFDLPDVKNREECMKFLQKQLPTCDIEYNLPED
ncbi:ATP5S (predicted) [Pycnogonum litorale]